MKALVLAAGLGTRLQPLTYSKPKALVEINGKTLLELTITRLLKFGFDQIIVNVHHFADQITDYLETKKNFGAQISISDESNLLLDTGGGLKNVSWFFNDGKPFLIHNVDVLTDFDLAKLYESHLGNNAVATLAVQNRKSSRYFLFDKEKNLCGWTNVKTSESKIVRHDSEALEPFAFSGIQIVSPAIFDLLPDDKVFSLVDLYLSVASKNRITYFDHTNSIFIDLGKKENLNEAESIISKIF
ncbi:MAG: nucleotidyltransferase family protein [Bacteroidetes bacterium]|nr:nucleotidyltransferase family protein [Bacteroidota bacterium]